MTKNLTTFLLLTLITVALWVAFQVFRVATKSTIPAPTQKQIEKLDPNLDKNVLEELKQLEAPANPQ